MGMSERWNLEPWTLPPYVDWWFVQELKGLSLSEEDGVHTPFEGKRLASVLAEYGQVAHKCAAVSGCELAIVIVPPSVWFCPSESGFNGVFIEPYSEDKFGAGVEVSKADGSLWDYCSINARLDGWNFFGGMVMGGKPDA